MKFNYQEASLKSGIYKILNTHTNQVYVGQAKEFKSRWSGHRSSLAKNKHGNKFIQADFNKCRELLGHDDFLEYHVLELLVGSTKEERNEREEWWIAQYYDKQHLCYNFSTKAISREGNQDRSPEASFQKRSIATKGRKHTAESKQRMSEIHKGSSNLRNAGKQHSEATKIKIAASNFGKVRSAETKAKLQKLARSKAVAVVAIHLISGFEQNFTAIRDAAKQLGLRSGCISQVLNGKCRHTGGYFFRLQT